MPVRVGTSDTPIPLHFAMGEDAHVEGVDRVDRCTGRCATSSTCRTSTPPTTTSSTAPSGPAPRPRPLAPFTAQRIDYSLARLAHYTATSAAHFQNHVLFTNYQFYMDEFVEFALEALADPASGYTAFVEPGNAIVDPRRAHRRADRAAAADAGLPPHPAAATPGSRWSTSASGRRTPRPSPTISPCCARTSG